VRRASFQESAFASIPSATHLATFDDPKHMDESLYMELWCSR
jgi:hypothetical protein